MAKTKIEVYPYEYAKLCAKAEETGLEIADIIEELVFNYLDTVKGD